MSRHALAGCVRRGRDHPVLVAFALYLVLGIIFFAPGLLPGHTTSAADILFSAAPWNTAVPPGVYHWSSHPLVVGSNPQLVDPVTVFEPYLQYTRSQLPHIALWNPYIMGGSPYLGDMQSAIFSPFSLPAYVLPFWWSLSVIAVMKVVVAALGAFLLARALSMRFAGAFLCGCVYGFGLFLVAWLPWPLANVFPLIPWMLFATERLVRRPGPGPAAGLATVVALQFFGGHPETSVHALAVTLAFFVLRVLQSPGGGVAALRQAAAAGRSRLGAVGRAVRRPVVVFVLAVGLGTLVAAVAIVPFLELLRHSSDLTSRPRSQVHVQPKYFFASLLPTYFPGSFEIETAFYAGALPLMLAVVALLRPTVLRVVTALFGALCVAIVLGVHPFFTIAARLPGFDLTYLSRLTILYLLAVAVLAGFGLDDLVARRPTGWSAAGVAAVSVGLLVLPVVIVFATGQSSLRFLRRAVDMAWTFAAAPAATAPHVDEIVRLAALVVWVSVAGASVLLLLLRLGRRLPPAVFAALAVALVVGDLFQAGFGQNPAIPESHAVQPVTGAIRYLQRAQRAGHARFVAVAPYIGTNPIPPDVNLRYGLYDARGYDLPVVDDFGRLWARYVAPPTPLLPLDTPAVPVLVIAFQPPALRVLSLLGVTDILEQKAEKPLQLPDTHVVYDGPDATIYENDDALPRTWLVGQQDVVHGDAAALSAVGAASFRPRQTVVTETPLPHLATASAGTASAGKVVAGNVATAPSGAAAVGTARITDYAAERVAIDADADRAGELVLSDTYYPGWRVTVNGRPATIDRVDYTLRGVAVPAGTDHVVFSYDPTSFRIGAVVTLGATAVLVVTAGVAVTEPRRRGRRRGRHRAGARP